MEAPGEPYRLAYVRDRHCRIRPGTSGSSCFSRFARTQALGDWLGWAWLFGVGLVAVVLLLFPTGALPSRRWRPVAWAMAAGLAGWVLGNAFAPTIFSADSRPANPFGIGGVAGKVFLILAGGGAALIALSGVAAIVSLVFRYRHARMVEREQLKWLVYAAGLIVVAHLASIGASSQLQNAVTSGAVAIVPVAIGVAIFRYHLYDIDLVINKTLVYGSLAAFITGVYVAIVVGIGSLVAAQGTAQPRPVDPGHRGGRGGVPAGPRAGAAAREPAGLREAGHAL